MISEILASLEKYRTGASNHSVWYIRQAVKTINIYKPDKMEWAKELVDNAIKTSSFYECEESLKSFVEKEILI